MAPVQSPLSTAVMGLVARDVIKNSVTISHPDVNSLISTAGNPSMAPAKLRFGYYT